MRSTTGEERLYHELVSTMPIHELLQAWPGAPAEARAAASRLRYNSLINVLLGISEDRGYPYTAVYVPDPDVIFPALVDELCTRRVLVMEYIDGEKILNFRKTPADPQRGTSIRRPVSYEVARSGLRSGALAVNPISSSRVGYLKGRPYETYTQSSSIGFPVTPAMGLIWSNARR